ncbi:hypothetical protein OXYTRIMIC_096 [Oxytricha trifallax]|uniref:Uncharacterized protein n=1 Tax=Oxytricha trifallax TaxID=1172189 RepID=A0A073HYA0_9SPIT|nr:hypothetical protein OXYTRIMIC_096 [Oxytricha trifallax]
MVFGQSGIARIKRLMEGEGMAIEQKDGGEEFKCTECFIVITSNTLPFSKMDHEDANTFLSRYLLYQSKLPTQSRRQNSLQQCQFWHGSSTIDFKHESDKNAVV